MQNKKCKGPGAGRTARVSVIYRVFETLGPARLTLIVFNVRFYLLPCIMGSKSFPEHTSLILSSL